MKKIDPILARIQSHFGAKTRKEMMERWKIPYNTLATWVNRDHIPPKRLHELAENENLDLDWLQSGMLPQSELLYESDKAEIVKNSPKNRLLSALNSLPIDEQEEVIKEIIPIILKRF